MDGKGSGRPYSGGSKQQKRIEEDAARLKKAIGVASQLRRAVDRMEPIDILDPVAVEARCEEFFDLCDEYGTHPTVAGMAGSLGFTGVELRAIALGRVQTVRGVRLTPEIMEILIKKFSEFEQIWENTFMSGGYSSPVTGIFWAKNNAGYRDQQERINVNVDVEPNALEIAQRYQTALPEHIDASGGQHQLRGGKSNRAALDIALGMHDRLTEMSKVAQEPDEIED